MHIVAGLGISGALFTFVIGFFPPSQFKTGNIFFYEGFLITGTAIMCAVPLVMDRFRRKEWVPHPPGI